MLTTRVLAKTLVAILFFTWHMEAALSETQPTPATPTENNQQTIKSANKKETAPALQETKKADKEETYLDTELKLMKEKNLLISDFQGSLISIVLWSLSAVVSVVILLVGASLFTNFKLHEKDLQRIQMDYDAKIKIFRSDMEASFAKTRQDIASAQDVRSQQDLNRMLDQASEVRAQFESVRLSLEDKFDQLLSSTLKFDEKIIFLQKTISKLSSEFRGVEAEVWRVRKIPTNILISTLQALDGALDSGENWRIKDSISDVKDVIKQEFLEGKGILDDDLQSFIERRIERLKVKYPEDTKEITSMVAECIRFAPDSTEKTNG